MFFRKKAAATSLDEFLGDSAGREASPLDLAGDPAAWQKRLAEKTRASHAPTALSLSAFTLIRGGDLFERKGCKRTERRLVDRYAKEHLSLVSNRVTSGVCDAVMHGVLRVISGNPAICLRMMLAKPIRIVLIPEGEDFRAHSFPKSTNPAALGIFYNSRSDATALIGLREEYVLDKPWLMIHEMAHAVHLMGMTKQESDLLSRFLLPVYGNHRHAEEAFAIYAERAFGATYTEGDMNAPEPYGRTRQEWTDRAVFALFMSELLAP